MNRRPYMASDNVGQPCSCLECQAAGVTHLRVVKVPADDFHPKPHWLHGDALRDWYAARDQAREAFKKLTNGHGVGGAS